MNDGRDVPKWTESMIRQMPKWGRERVGVVWHDHERDRGVNWQRRRRLERRMTARTVTNWDGWHPLDNNNQRRAEKSAFVEVTSFFMSKSLPHRPLHDSATCWRIHRDSPVVSIPLQRPRTPTFVITITLPFR